MITPRGGSNGGNSVGNIGEPLEYGNIRAETKLEDCGSVEVEMRNQEDSVNIWLERREEAQWQKKE